MFVRYIFNTSGDYVAFLSGGNLFSPNCEWLGFNPESNEIYDTNGNFIGSVLDDDRIVTITNQLQRLRRIRPLPPLRPLRPLRALRRLRMLRLPYGYLDVFEPGGLLYENVYKR